MLPALQPAHTHPPTLPPEKGPRRAHSCVHTQTQAHKGVHAHAPVHTHALARPGAHPTKRGASALRAHCLHQQLPVAPSGRAKRAHVCTQTHTHTPSPAGAAGLGRASTATPPPPLAIVTPNTSPPGYTETLPSAHPARRTLPSAPRELAHKPHRLTPALARAGAHARSGLAGRGAAFPLPFPSINSLRGSCSWPRGHPCGTPAPTAALPGCSGPRGSVLGEESQALVPLLQGSAVGTRRGFGDGSRAPAPVPPRKAVSGTQHSVKVRARLRARRGEPPGPGAKGKAGRGGRAGMKQSNKHTGRR